MKLEIIFKGKPSEFGIAAEAYSHRAPATEDGRRLFFLNHREALGPDTNPVRVILRSQKSSRVDTLIKAHFIPGGNTLLMLDSTDDQWTEIESSWNLLLDELTKQGWTEPKRKLERIEKRRADVKRLWNQGKTDAQIAEKLSVDDRTIRRDREALGLNLK